MPLFFVCFPRVCRRFLAFVRRPLCRSVDDNALAIQSEGAFFMCLRVLFSSCLQVRLPPVQQQCFDHPKQFTIFLTGVRVRIFACGPIVLMQFPVGCILLMSSVIQHDATPIVWCGFLNSGLDRRTQTGFTCCRHPNFVKLGY